MPLAGAWVNRWQVSPPLPPLPLPFPHLQSFVSLRYRTFLLGTENAVGGGHGSLAVYAILFSSITTNQCEMLLICSGKTIITLLNP